MQEVKQETGKTESRGIYGWAWWQGFQGRSIKEKEECKKSAAKEKGTKAKKTIELCDKGEYDNGDDDLPKKFMVYLDIKGPKVATAWRFS